METLTSGKDMLEFPYGLLLRRLPGFADQASESARQALIKSAAETVYGMGADTSISGNVLRIAVYAEQQALEQTRLLLKGAMTNPRVPEDIASRAKDVYDNLSFVGEKELTEAAQSIARYWKAYLNEHPSSSLFVITSRTFDDEHLDYEDNEVSDAELGYVSDNKSADHILNEVLSNFTDEELREYGGRLLFSVSEFKEHDPQTVKSLVLDDWIMSGQQMEAMLSAMLEYVTPIELEINLVVSSEDRLTKGFTHSKFANPIPVKACFVSHAANHSYAAEFGGAYLTAAHSTGDYPFENTMAEIVEAMNRVRIQEEERVYMPPLANIVRPYYSPDYQPHHVERLRLLRSMGRKGLLNK